MIKKFTKFLLFTFCPFVAFSQVAPGVEDVLISELSRLNINEDFIELYNNTNNSITLADCKLIRTQSGAGSASYIYDFNSEGSGDIIIPANGFLVVGRNVSESSFNTYWGVTLSGNYNNTGGSNAINSASFYSLKYGGTANTDDGTEINNTNSAVATTNKRFYQLPLGNFNYTSVSSVDLASPGSFKTVEDLTHWDYVFDGSWAGGTPSGASGSENIIIQSSTYSFADGVIVNDLYLQEDAKLYSVNNSLTIQGDLTMEPQSSVAILGTGTMTVSGTSEIQTTGNSSSNNYNIWSSPFNSNTNIISSFSGVNPCDVYLYSAIGQVFTHDYSVPFATTCNGASVTFTAANVINSTEGTADGLMDIGKGYFVPGNSSDTRTFSSSSSPNNGTINIPVYGSSKVIAGGNDWNLLGNPYPSSLRVATLLLYNGSYANAIYVYNGSTGAYETYNSSSSFFLSSCQGFFIDANTTTDGYLGDFRFVNAARRTTNTTFRKVDSTATDTTIAFLSLSNGALSDQIQIYLDNECLDGHDSKFDARKLMNDHNLNFASLIETDPVFGPEPFVFNGVNTLSDQESKILNLFVQTNEPGSFNISLDSLRDMPLGIGIHLEDTENSTITDLRATNYNFNSSVGDSLTNRFRLHLNYDASITSIEDLKTTDLATIYEHERKIKIALKDNEKLNSVSIYDVTGRLVSYEIGHSNWMICDANNFGSGIFIVKAISRSGAIFTKKIVLH
ncbi:MAG: hypothetical protein ACPGVC_05325 [Salibacteraceae bacterium]